MSEKHTNLQLANVENREMRLGTIISWDGSAKELAEQSNYEQRGQRSGCPGAGKGCRLCELQMPFNQQTMCCHAIIETQAANLPDCILIEHSPIGCSARLPRINLTYKGGLSRRHKPQKNIQAFSTNLLEKDMVFGAGKKLRQTIQDAWERFHPKAIFLATSCSTAIIGEDVESVAEEMSGELGIPVIPLQCEGFRSKHWSTGFDIAQHGVVRQIVNKHPQKQKDLINIVALWGTDYFTEMLKPLGLRVNYLLDMASYQELEQASEAVATSTFCHTLGSYLGTALEENYGVPQIKAPMPYGFAGTDAWLRAIAKVVGKEAETEAYIASEHVRVQPEIEELKKKLAGVHGFICTGSAYAHAVIEVVRELGVTVDGSAVFHHDPVYDSGDPNQNSLKHLVDHYGNIPHFSVSKTQQFQLYGLLKRTDPDFIIIRHNGLSPLAVRMGIPAFAMGDEHLAVGYDGMIRVGNALLEILSRKKFGKVLQRHVKLPYTEWWLQQEDPYILARQPEILDAQPDRFARKRG